MKIDGSSLYKYGVCVALLLPLTTANAEIYKWLDEKGQTHYSERKEDAGKSRPEAVKIQRQRESMREGADTQYWQEQDREYKQRQLQQQIRTTFPRFKSPRPVVRSEEKSDNPDASKCNLARDVLSGAVRHRNGAPTDQYDRDVAENDVRNFCR